jgi:hypothetical protein
MGQGCRASGMRYFLAAAIVSTLYSTVLLNQIKADILGDTFASHPLIAANFFVADASS